MFPALNTLPNKISIYYMNNREINCLAKETDSSLGMQEWEDSNQFKYQESLRPAVLERRGDIL